jgi:ABC-type sugar transport system ATPase subunit
LIGGGHVMEGLKMENISKSYGNVKALVNVDFISNYGEIHALLGENGAGKSTLIKILSRVIKEDKGTISLNGKILKMKDPDSAIKNGIGTVYQDLSLIPDITVADNIFFNSSDLTNFGSVSFNTIYKKTIELFRYFKVNEIAEIDPKTEVNQLQLSKRQIVEIIKVIGRNPDVLILDEPTSTLSDSEVKWLIAMVKSFAIQGKIVIFISHKMAEVQELADKITVFRNGENVGTRLMKETNSDELVSLILGRKLLEYFPKKVDFVQKDVALETRSLNYGKDLKDISFKLHKGEILGVGGLAGQGQLMLFLSLFGIFKARGEFFVNGKKINVTNPANSIKNGLALIPEDRNREGLIPSMSIKNNITLSILKSLTKYGLINRKLENKVVEKIFNELRIKAEGYDTLVSSLSGGNQQKVVIGKLMATEPSIFLMYDITKGVDVGTKSEIFLLIEELLKRGCAVLYYSTTIDELVNICDRVIIMHYGRIAEDLSGSNLSKENIIHCSIGEKINNKNILE